MLSPIRRSRPRPGPRAVTTLVLLTAMALAAGACGSTPVTPVPSAAGPTVGPSDTTTPSEVPASPASSAPAGPTAAPPSPAVGQTDTEWGRIWDALPATFPRYPGGTTADDATDEPVSAAYVLAGVDLPQLASWMQASVETATYSTEALSGPLEDGGYVLDSVGDGGCRIETRMAPQGSLVLVTVRYGAACPAP